VGELRAYAAMMGGQFRSATSYRASFVVDLVTNVLATVLDVTTVFVLFRAAPTVGGFTLAQAVLITGLTSAGFVLADVAVGNVDHLQTYVRAGTLDAVLVRPLGVLPQLLLMDLPVRKALRVLVGLATYGAGIALNPIDWTPGRVLLVVVAPIAAAVFFGAIFVLSASLAFWWIDAGQVGNAFTYGGRDFTSYPVTVYSRWFRTVFAYAMGFGFVSYQPALALLGHVDPLGLPAWAGYTSPVVALLAAVLAAVVWRIGVRQYRSTGS
jgi:viologen exporter family transport system permease protein